VTNEGKEFFFSHLFAIVYAGANADRSRRAGGARMEARMVHFAQLSAPRGLGLLLCCAGLAGAARAQDAATVYGYLDLGLVRESGAGARLDRGLNNWLGVRGVEGLDGDLAATFNVQMRFDPDTGMQERASTLFQGETTVGLRSKTLGGLRLGRALSPLWQEKWRYDPWYDSGFMGSLESYNGDFDSDGLPSADFHNYSRVGNGVFYASPGLGGVRFFGMAELEAPAAGQPVERARGAALTYADGAATAMLSYERNHVADSIVYLAGSYRIDQLTVLGAYSRSRLVLSGGERRSALLAGTYALGAQLLRFGYGRLRESGQHKASVGLSHALSKRTNIYADLYREKMAATGNGGASDGMALNGVALGINHAF